MRIVKQKRGATAIGYGLLIGLISVSALAAITSVGSSVDEVFVSTGGELGRVVTETGSETVETAAEDPTPQATPIESCGSMTLMATAPRAGGGTWGLCRFQRNDAQQLSDARALAQTCIAPSQVADTAFVTVDFPGVSAGESAGAVRYEVGTISDSITVQTGSTDRDVFNCTNASCSATTQVSGTLGVSGNLNSLNNAEVCELSLDGQDLTGQRATTPSPILRIEHFANMGGTGGTRRFVPSPPVIQYYSFRRAGTTSHFNTIGAAVLGNVLIRID